MSDVIHERGDSPPLPVAAYLEELDRYVGAHDPSRQDRIVPAIGQGTASREVVRRAVLELYYIGRWTAPELPLLIANAPDAYAFTIDDSRHYRHWAERFGTETGYLGGANHLQMTVDVCRQLGLSDDAIRAYVPLPETIAMAFTMLYSVRRSYEEGLAVIGYVGERVAGGPRYASSVYEGLRDHYGVTVRGFEVEPERGARAIELLRPAAITCQVQERCRAAIRNALLVAEARARAANRWLD
jgi:pyrroloquinoline quinone (PQQ) biosynthesis protein C